MSGPNPYYRIYNVTGGNMCKQRLRLPERWATPKKRFLEFEHKIPDKGEAIAILEAMCEMMQNGENLSSLCYRYAPLNLDRQLALAELGTFGSGRLIAVTTQSNEVRRLD